MKFINLYPVNSVDKRDVTCWHRCILALKINIIPKHWFCIYNEYMKYFTS
ncbi:uncharacterized protein Smp_203890 [Schistosoma mansoni]|nr:uncharacterized protein Smp_203890 [Schistosoma mansoni]|eukprot:XP_018655335.1 uncharacterized protein Smp_203890 [Schistosoma mansoni]